MRDAEIRELPGLVGERVRVSGWLYNARSSGKLHFLVVRDGSGYLQSVVFKPAVDERVWEEAGRVTQESSLQVVGTVKEETRAPGGVELQVEEITIVQPCPDYPITPKEHGPDFLLNHRHLWLRSKRQHAIMRVRNELTFGIRDFFYNPALRQHRLADPHPGRVRGDLDAFRDRLLRREGVPVAVGAALPRTGGGRARQGVLLRADVPCREVQDPLAPDGVLDGRARGRLDALRRPARTRRGVRLDARRAHPRPLQAGTRVA